MLQPQNLNYSLLSIFLDASSLMMALLFAERIRNVLGLGRVLGQPMEITLPILVIALGSWLVSFGFLAIYDPQKNTGFAQGSSKIALGILLMLLLMAGTLYFSLRDISRLFILYFAALYLLLLLGWRVIYHSVWPNPQLLRRTIIIGEGALIPAVVEALHQHERQSNLHLVGIISNSDLAAPFDALCLGQLDQSKAIIEREEIHAVVMTLTNQDYNTLNMLVMELQKLPVQIHVILDYYHLALYRATVETLAELPVVNLRTPALTPYQRLVKRLFDLMIGSLLLVMSLPLLLLIALIVKLDDPRESVIFKQTRVGENGQLFKMYKFRSMIRDADQQAQAQIRPNKDGISLHKHPDDPRITRIGHFLRRTSLDELPQFGNVLRGDMSLVGPRPEMPWLVDQYQPWQRSRFAVPQGITGWWQLKSRMEQPMLLHIEDDIYYIQHYSIWLDMMILLRTVVTIFYRHGAY